MSNKLFKEEPVKRVAKQKQTYVVEYEEADDEPQEVEPSFKEKRKAYKSKKVEQNIAPVAEPPRPRKKVQQKVQEVAQPQAQQQFDRTQGRSNGSGYTSSKGELPQLPQQPIYTNDLQAMQNQLDSLRQQLLELPKVKAERKKRILTEDQQEKLKEHMKEMRKLRGKGKGKAEQVAPVAPEPVKEVVQAPVQAPVAQPVPVPVPQPIQQPVQQINFSRLQSLMRKPKLVE